MSEKSKYIAFRIMRILSATLGLSKENTLYGQEIIGVDDGGKEIINLLLSDNPCCIGRIGTEETLTINSALDVSYGLRKHIKSECIERSYTNTGFFPKNEELLFQFKDLNIAALGVCDYFGCFENHHADWMLQRYLPQSAKIAVLRSLEPYYSKFPWTVALEGKKVLVVHPFEKTIRQQYAIKEKIWGDKNILPDFELHTVKAVQTIGDNTAGFSNWFKALDYMKTEISEIDFDIAILGCGAYAFPLAAYIKSELRKKSIVLGGATQILFGIKGSRWTNHPVISQFFNENWVSPSKDEVPEGFKKVENGCYW